MVFCLAALIQFFAVVAGSVMLIQIGTWISILSAILIMVGYFVVGALLIIAWGMGLDKNKEKKEE